MHPAPPKAPPTLARAETARFALRRLFALGLVAALALRAARAQDEAAESAPPPRAPLVVRLMSFNLRWDGFDDGANAWVHRRDLVCQVLRDFGPDSVGTQEPMKRQIADIEAAIPTLASYRFDNDPVYTRTQQILYRRDRFDRVDAGGFLVAEGENEDGTVRYCTWVLLAERATGRRYVHYNVHLDHRDADSRRASVVRLMRHVVARGRDDPFVVTGDFNTGEKSPEMAFLRGERTLPDPDGDGDGDGAAVTNPIPLVDTFRALHPDAEDAGTGTGFRGNRRSGKIDHVLLARGAAEVREAEIVRTNEDGRYPSDHLPVTAVVAWP